MRKVFYILAWLSFVLVVLAIFPWITSAEKDLEPERRGLLIECEINRAILKKYPEQIVLVTSVDAMGKPNIITMGWSMFCSGDPPMVAISVGKTRYSHKLIFQTKEFVYTFPGEDLEKEMLYCGTHSGRDVDKFKETGLTAVEAKFVKPPLIEECIANFECQVVGEYDAGDHTIFVGKIVATWISEKARDKKRLFNLGTKFGGLP